MLRRSEPILCDNGYLHHQGTAKGLRAKPVQKGMEGLPSCQCIGEKMAQYLNCHAIDFDTVDYEEENS